MKKIRIGDHGTLIVQNRLAFLFLHEYITTGNGTNTFEIPDEYINTLDIAGYSPIRVAVDAKSYTGFIIPGRNKIFTTRYITAPGEWRNIPIGASLSGTIFWNY